MYILVNEMIPSYQIIQDRYQLEFEGLNLEVKHRMEILARTLEINAENIRGLGTSDRFYIQSVTDPSCEYLVDLNNCSCDCPDWPRVCLCKHLTAVVHFFRHGNQQFGEEDEGTTTTPPGRDGSPDAHSDSSANSTHTNSIVKGLIAVSSDFLDDNIASSASATTVRDWEMLQVHLNAVVQISCHPNSPPLPDNEAIPPNQGAGWTKTTERMGATRQKRRRSGTVSSPEPSATARIGDLNHTKP